MATPSRSALVTGGAGFIGAHLAEALLEEFDVTILDDLSTGSRTAVPDPATFVEGDVRDRPLVDEIVAEVDLVFHHAAMVSVPLSIDRPHRSHTVTATGTLNVLEAARHHDVRTVVASSAAIYGDPTSIPIAEDHPPAPTSPYGLDKLSADSHTRLYHDLYGLETVALRYFNVFGPHQTGGAYAGVIATFVEQALGGDDLTVHGDGEQTRDFVYVDDVVRANLLAAETTGVGEAINIGTGEPITVRRLAELVRELTDANVDIVHTEPREGDIERSIADISKARTTLGFEPTVDTREGLNRTIEWYRTRD